MTARRYNDNGFLLPDGRVLIMPGNGILPIEMYDPHSGRFDAVAGMPSNVNITTATLLPSGEVFVTSWDHTGVFDPDTRAFHSIFKREETRRLHTATLLKDGRVLVVGGVHRGFGRRFGLDGTSFTIPRPGAYSKLVICSSTALTIRRCFFRTAGS